MGTTKAHIIYEGFIVKFQMARLHYIKYSFQDSCAASGKISDLLFGEYKTPFILSDIQIFIVFT